MSLSELDKPFSHDDIEWRVKQAGKTNDGKVWAMVLAYVTNRAIMQRLDEVCGKENWKNEYKEWRDKSVLCGISIKIDGEWVTKWDGSDETDIEATKGSLSGAMKRAAVQWGIGRYLYNLEAGFAKVSDKGKYKQAGKEGKYPPFKWDAPDLPGWALPDSTKNNNAEDTEKEMPNMFAECNTLEELKQVWELLTPAEKKQFKDALDERKSQLK